MNCEEIKIWIPEYIDDSLDESEREKIRIHLEECSSCRTTKAELAEFMRELSEIPQLEPSIKIKEGFLKQIPRKNISMLFKIAAILIPAFGIFWLGFSYGEKKYSEELKELSAKLEIQKQNYLLASINEQSSSQKIEAVYKIVNEQVISDDLISALVNMMNTDKNVNVRLAAIHSLSEMIDKNEVVRKELIKSLSLQENPLLQISLIQVLTEKGIKEAKEEIETFSNSPNVDKQVKDYVESMLTQI